MQLLWGVLKIRSGEQHERSNYWPSFVQAECSQERIHESNANSLRKNEMNSKNEGIHNCWLFLHTDLKDLERLGPVNVSEVQAVNFKKIWSVWSQRWAPTLMQFNVVAAPNKSMRLDTMESMGIAKILGIQENENDALIQITPGALQTGVLQN